MDVSSLGFSVPGRSQGRTVLRRGTGNRGSGGEGAELSTVALAANRCHVLYTSCDITAICELVVA